MFRLFKKKLEVDKLNDKYNALLKEAHLLSSTSRKLSDAKVAEANDVLKQIEHLEKKN